MTKQEQVKQAIKNEARKHRRVWMDFWQELIPKGFDIHHKDHNHKNNDPLNLELMTHEDHTKYHWSKDGGEKGRKISKSNKGKTPWNKGLSATAEACQHQSDSHKGQTPWNKGKTHSEEAKRKISAAGMGRICSDETKAKMSKARKGRAWITDGITNRRINLEEESLPEGWRTGRTIGKKW